MRADQWRRSFQRVAIPYRLENRLLPAVFRLFPLQFVKQCLSHHRIGFEEDQVSHCPGAGLRSPAPSTRPYSGRDENRVLYRVACPGCPTVRTEHSYQNLTSFRNRPHSRHLERSFCLDFLCRLPCRSRIYKFPMEYMTVRALNKAENSPWKLKVSSD
ncbi:hypothetical protein LP7551_02300 [Roseibium album]|nr:hypothetical protein LP7551_02300 [Roseibium album]